MSIFIAVISAFALNNWNDNRKNSKAENRILHEISNGLQKDLKDVELNVFGHQLGLQSSRFWRKVILNKEVKLDSIHTYYFNFLRDFISIQNTSGYENLKSRGLELIKNDSLRSDIIALYEYDYKTLKTLEETYDEMQFHKNYFKEINHFIAPSLKFDEKGNIVGIEQPINLSKEDQKKLLSYLWKIETNRTFTLGFYQQIKNNIQVLQTKIEKQLH